MYDELLDDEILDPSVLELGPRDAAQSLLRAQLERDAERKQLTSDSFRARLRVARQAGIPVVDLLRRTGAARQTVYDAFKAPIGRELDDLSVLALIASGAAQTAEALVEVTGSEPESIRRRLFNLRSADYIDVLDAGRAASGLGVFSITAKGLHRLHAEIDAERLRSAHSDSWTVFLLIPAKHEDAILTAAALLLGKDLSYGVIHTEVAPSRMRGPELAVQVRAPDLREALILVEVMWSKLRQAARVRLPAVPHIAAVSPPRP